MNAIADLIRHITEDPNDPRVRLRRQFAEFEDSLEKFGRSASRAGHRAADEAGDVFDHALHQGTAAARAVGSGLNAVGRQVSRDPLPLIVAAGTVALIALLLRR